MKRILLGVICVANTLVFAQKQELVFFEDFENPEMPSIIEYATVDTSAKHTTTNAITGSGSLEVNTLGKLGYPMTLSLDAKKILGEKYLSCIAYVSFKYKVLGVDKNREPRNYFLCEDSKRRVCTEVFGSKVGETGTVKVEVRLISKNKYNFSMTSLDGIHIAIDDLKVERCPSPKESEWMYEDNLFIGMKFLPTHPNFLTSTAPENKLTKEQFFPFVDKFGQYKHRDWTTKVKSEADFAIRIKEEEAFNASLPKIENRDNYFGLINPKYKFKATGHFYTKKVDGRWWLVTPEGNLFWSHGIDTVGIASDTPTTKREHYFEDISDKNFIHSYFGGKHSYTKGKIYNYDFGNRNLTLKYGKNHSDRYAKVIGKRFSAWGINTSGAWCSYAVMTHSKVPYTFLGNSGGATNFKGTSQLVEYWQPMKDYFEPDFEKITHQNMAKNANLLRSPYCIGAFIDNELPWQPKDYSTAMRILTCPKTQKSKQVFMLMLKDKYVEIDALNTAWKSNYKNWDSFLNTVNFVPKTEQGKADMLAFEIKFYERYFSVCRSAVKAVAPDTLYIGCRFAWGNQTVAKVASRYCDVVSYNLYRDNVVGFSLPKGSEDKPVIVGEFHFGNQDGGIFGGGLRPRKTMKDRVDSYEAYVISALENPTIVGAHWFRWFDQITTGRCGDGENYSVGMVDICDTPVYPMIKKAHELSTKMYDIRQKASTKKRKETTKTVTY
ncbi:MAG: hypothetical protein J6B07_06650 [Opitutales bacterium]|nr:hypothetical protein [Opitutales bacterium]